LITARVRCLLIYYSLADMFIAHLTSKRLAKIPKINVLPRRNQSSALPKSQEKSVRENDEVSTSLDRKRRRLSYEPQWNIPKDGLAKLQYNGYMDSQASNMAQIRNWQPSQRSMDQPTAQVKDQFSPSLQPRDDCSQPLMFHSTSSGSNLLPIAEAPDSANLVRRLQTSQSHTCGVLPNWPQLIVEQQEKPRSDIIQREDTTNFLQSGAAVGMVFTEGRVGDYWDQDKLGAAEVVGDQAREYWDQVDIGVAGTVFVEGRTNEFWNCNEVDARMAETVFVEGRTNEFWNCNEVDARVAEIIFTKGQISHCYDQANLGALEIIDSRTRLT
jgi:hypothetical protein